MKRHPHPHSWLATQLEAWQKEGWVSTQAAEALRQRYPTDPPEPSHRLPWFTVILGVFGSLLIMGGIILLFAHNWHGLSRPIRTLLSVIPMLVFQGLAIWTVIKRPGSSAWREGVGIGLTLSIGAAIGLIAQTYQLGGDLGRFMLTWSLLTLPVIYALRCGTALWFYLYFAIVYAGYMREVSHAAPGFFLLYFAVIPFVVWANWKTDHHVLGMAGRYALAIAIWAGLPLALDYRWDGAWLPTLAAAAGAMILWDRSEDGKIIHLGRHPFALTAAAFAAGTIAVFSFEDVWKDYGGAIDESVHIGPFTLVLAGSIAAAWATGLVWRARQRAFWPVLLGGTFPALALIGWWLADHPDAAFRLMFATNALGLGVGIAAIVQALREDRLSLLNFGLILVGGLVLLRFFDSDLGFMVRGLSFIGLGLAFLVANFLFVRHRSAHTHLQEVQS